jgi:Beta-ketoacyl synthase, N-terminal domain
MTFKIIKNGIRLGNLILKKHFSTGKSYKYSDRKVVITGMGTVNPLGISTLESWENLKNLKSGIRNLENESYSKDLPKNCLIGATIPTNFNPNNYKTLVL